MATRSTFTPATPAKVLVGRAGVHMQVGETTMIYKPHQDVYAERPTSGDGWSPHALRKYKHTSMSASGLVSVNAQPAQFALLRVNAPARSGTLTINLRNGGPAGAIVRTVSATAGATIDSTGSLDAFPAGLYFEAVGGPTRGLDVSVYFL